MEIFPVEFWVGFLVFIVFALALDLGLLHKKAHTPTFREASLMTGIWVCTSLVFCALIYLYAGSLFATKFLTGYIIELSLSMDNVFVFIMIFSYFKVPLQYQHRVLFWGILGAIIMRFFMIIGGVYLVHHFEWLFIFLGAFLIYTGYKIATTDHDKQEVKEGQKSIITLISRFVNVTKEINSEKFFIKKGKKYYATPLFIVLLLVEKTDLVFALDSIPAILAITKEPFIVFTSNIFAILGLRSMYFLLATIMHMFRFLKFGISLLLIFVGFKMIFAVFGYKMDVLIALGLIVSIISSSIIASLLFPKQKKL